jgi:4-hydroxy-3-methylbut-2-enyl diphosphate reductase
VAAAEAVAVPDGAPLAFLSQTTLSVDDTVEIIGVLRRRFPQIEALRKRFPAVVGPDVKDICYATQNRQTAVRELAGMVDVLLVVGAQNSSNSNRLREIGKELDVPSYLIDDASALKPEWLEGAGAVGISAGASAPEALVKELIERLSELAEIEVEHLDGINENVQFKLPDELREHAA